MENPNILYIAIDSLRTDALQHTDTLRSLADEHIYFENAITPATWSLPAYTSLLSGEYPHSHGVTQPGDVPDKFEVVETLSKSGYSTYGVSGNPFFSPSQGFDQPFDRFWLTPRMWFSKGIDVSNHEEALKKAARGSLQQRIEGLSKFGSEFLEHPHRLKSLGNVAYFIAHRMDLDRFFDATIPHPLFDKPAYRPETNTSIINRLLEAEADDPTPFFIFAQYNDPHHENWPPKEIRKDIGWDGTESEIKEINDQTATIQYLTNEVPQEVVKRRRELYRGDVKHVDEHIREIIERLKDLDLCNDTVVVITADHGENLGDEDRRGRRRMGHFASMSETLVNVPLIVAYPDSEAETVHDPVSTKDIGSAIVDGSFFDENQTVDPHSVLPEDGVVLSEAPAKGGIDALLNNHPKASVDVVEEETSENTVLGKFEGRNIIRSSTGKEWAWTRDGSEEYSLAPKRLRNTVETSLKQLNDGYEKRELTGSVRRNLEDMGYL